MVSFRLKVDPSNEKPLWQQVEEGVRKLITSGILAPGSLIISVRELAQELKINPTIVAKAYQRLIDTGLLVNKRWEGIIVANYLTVDEQKDLLHQEALRYAYAASELGIEKEVAVQQLKMAFHNIKLQQGKLKVAVKLTRLGQR